MEIVLDIMLVILAFINVINIMRLERHYKNTIRSIIKELNGSMIIGNVEDTVYNNGFNWGLLKAIDIVSKYKE